MQIENPAGNEAHGLSHFLRFLNVENRYLRVLHHRIIVIYRNKAMVKSFVRRWMLS